MFTGTRRTRNLLVPSCSRLTSGILDRQSATENVIAAKFCFLFLMGKFSSTDNAKPARWKKINWFVIFSLAFELKRRAKFPKSPLKTVDVSISLPADLRAWRVTYCARNEQSFGIDFVTTKRQNCAMFNASWKRRPRTVEYYSSNCAKQNGDATNLSQREPTTRKRYLVWMTAEIRHTKFGYSWLHGMTILVLYSVYIRM